jgi:hypothetical protein
MTREDLRSLDRASQLEALAERTADLRDEQRAYLETHATAHFLETKRLEREVDGILRGLGFSGAAQGVQQIGAA